MNSLLGGCKLPRCDTNNSVAETERQLPAHTSPNVTPLSDTSISWSALVVWIPSTRGQRPADKWWITARPGHQMTPLVKEPVQVWPGHSRLDWGALGYGGRPVVCYEGPREPSF